jgi:hypothetical protein
MAGVGAGVGDSSSSSNWRMYSGERGEHYELFLLRARGDIYDRQLKQHTYPFSFKTQLDLLRRHVMPSSDADAAMQLFARAFVPVARQVAMGFWPRAELPPDIVEYLRGTQPTVRDIAAFINAELVESAAIQAGAEALSGGQPQRFLVAQHGAAERMQQQAALLIDAEQHPLPAVLTTLGDYTPAEALMELFCAALTLTFKYVGQAAFAEFTNLGTAGCQGTKGIVPWQLYVAKQLAYVSHLSGVQPTTPFQVFLAGLNDDRLTQMGWQYYNNQPDITLEQLARKLQLHEANL